MIKHWATTQSSEIGDYYIFRLNKVKRTSPRTGTTHDFVALDAPDWINILPITPDGQFVCVRQYRHGTNAITTEIPAGMMDPHEQDPIDAARRELLEETGYYSADIRKIGTTEPNPAFLNNKCHLYLALDAVQIEQPKLDGKEDIELVTYPLSQLDELIDQDTFTHSLTICNFYYFDRYCRKHKLMW